MPHTLPPRSVLRARLARSVQLGAPDDQIRQMRSQYHLRALADHVAEVGDQLLPEHRRALAQMVAGGDADAA
ncbi:MAG: hypothetical protein ACYCVZ_04690 [Streptosporangiaceae bacterium]